MTIIRKSVSLANAPALEEFELLNRAKDWALELFEFVPENLLAQAAKQAFADHAGSYPLTAYEIKDAHTKLKRQNVEQVALSKQLPHSGTDAPKYCYNYLNHLHGKPEIKLHLPGIMPDGIDAVVPCGGCRPEEFWATKTGIIGKHKEANVIDGIEIFKKGKDAA